MKYSQIAINIRTIFFAMVMLSCATRTLCAGPLLLRTDKVQCYLSIDGDNIGPITGDAYFIRVNIGPGQHIVQCKDAMTFRDNDSQKTVVPFAIDTTVNVPNSPEQLIIDLPHPVIHLEDFARSFGSRSFAARIAQPYPFYGVIDPQCGPNHFDERIRNLEALRDQRAQDVIEALHDTDFMHQMCDEDNSNNRNGPSTACTNAKREYTKAVNDATERKRQTDADLLDAREAQRQFHNRLQTTDVAVFPNCRAACGVIKYVCIELDGEKYLASPAFKLTSADGGTFEIR